ncbi:MAG: hypothetical protein Q7K35_01165 [bacterium]|nr:hypothetical protein [bacterium]
MTFFPMPNKPALVALAVWNREKTPSDWVRAYFLDITWKDGGLPWIDLDEAWIPSGDQPAQASKWGVTVKIGGVTYGSCPNDINRQSAMLRFVRDGNLLYRFLAGEATAEEVVAAAEAFQEEEAWPTKYAALQRLLNEEKSAFAQSQVELRAKCRESAKAMSKEADARIAELHEALRKIARIAHSARFGNRAKTLQTILKIIWP